MVGPSVGRLIDRHGGRHLLATSNLVIAAGLLILAAAHSIAGLVIAWTVLGVGIGMGLYDPAFAALTWLYGRDARSSITGITLIAGFASTIGWPLTAVLLHALGWRGACLVWAGLNLLLAAPVNWLAIPRHGMPTAPPQAAPELPSADPPRAAMPILAFFFATTWFVQERWRRICRACCRRRAPPRPRRSPPRRWSAPATIEGLSLPAGSRCSDVEWLLAGGKAR